MTPLPAGGQPRTRDGICRSEYHGLCRGGHGVPHLARRYRVNGVPKTVVNEEVEILGALPESDFIEQALAKFM